jgi:hypothetical protein
MMPNILLLMTDQHRLRIVCGRSHPWVRPAVRVTRR